MRTKPATTNLNDQALSPDHCKSHAAILTEDQFHKVAVLVADGEMPFPGNVEPTERLRLAAAVGRRRRSKLIRYIAQAIAKDIHRSRAHKHGG